MQSAALSHPAGWKMLSAVDGVPLELLLAVVLHGAISLHLLSVQAYHLYLVAMWVGPQLCVLQAPAVLLVALAVVVAAHFQKIWVHAARDKIMGFLFHVAYKRSGKPYTSFFY